MSETAEQGWATGQVRTWAASRSPEALGELLKWQRDRAYAVALRILGREADAEDAVQEAFLKLLAGAPEFTSPEEFRAIVGRSVAQRAIDTVRKAKRHRELEKAMQDKSPPGDEARASRPERAETLAGLEEELAVLDPADRALLAMTCQEGLGTAEAAAALDMPRETARDRLRQLLGQLRERLSRRGLALALLPLIELLREGGSARAGEALCRALDAALPGLPCRSVAAAGPAAVSASAILAQAGLAAGIAVKLATAGAVLAAAVCAVSIYRALAVPARVGATLPAARPATAPAEPAPAKAPAPPPPGPEPAAPVPAEGGAREVKVPLAELPPAVRAGAEAAVKGLILVEAERQERRGSTIYEVDGRVGNKRFEVRVAPDGRVLGVREERDDDEDEDGGRDRGGAGEPAGRPPGPAEVF